MRRFLTLVLLVALGCVHPVVAQTGDIEQLEVLGLFRMTREAFLHAFEVRVGDPYDAAKIRSRFRALWKLGLFEDLSIEAEPGAEGGTVLVVKVKERPVLTAVTYQETKHITRTEIDDALRERGFRPELGKPLDLNRIYFAEAAIRDLLGAKGFLDSEVEADIRTVTETTRAVHFFIGAGGKTRIRRIGFTGNETFSTRRLKSQLTITAERKWYWPWSKKNLYHPGKWDQDVSGIRDLYLNNGYLDVEIRPPVVETIQTKGGKPEADGKPSTAKAAVEAQKTAVTETASESTDPAEADRDLTPKQAEKEAARRAKRAAKVQKREDKQRRKEDKSKKVKRLVRLTVPVNEGEQYTLGEVTISGNESYKSQALRAFIPLAEGSLLQNNRLDAGIDRITRLYEDRGHLYANVVRRIQRRDGEKVADVEVTVDEDQPYYLGRIDFSGNTSTKDQVLRREMLLMEGELFSRSKLDFSRAKVNQLGYFQIPDEPVIEPIEGEQRVKVTMSGQEQGRNEIQVGGGYSGLDGAFFNGVYSTRNFLGRGQVLSTAVQVGGRSTRYQISFQEPWFLNRPYRFGFSVFRRDLDFGSSLRSTSTGGGLLLGKRLSRFSSLNVGYNWESVSSTTTLVAATGGVSEVTTIETDTEVSSLTPVFSYNTINNPYRPTGGKSFTLSTQVAGGPLGGDTSFIKPIATFIGYRKAIRRSFIGFHAQMGMIREFGDGTLVGNSNIEGVPRFQRFWLGGDTLGPRIFETRSITPLRYVTLADGNRIVDVLGDPRFTSPDDFFGSGGIPALLEVGGDRFFLFQTEWVVPLNEQAEIAFFVDAGDALFEDQSLTLETTRVSAGVEVRFHLPIFPVPLRLIYGVPVRELNNDQTSNFTFSIGRSF